VVRTAHHRNTGNLHSVLFSTPSSLPAAYQRPHGHHHPACTTHILPHRVASSRIAGVRAMALGSSYVPFSSPLKPMLSTRRRGQAPGSQAGHSSRWFSDKSSSCGGQTRHVYCINGRCGQRRQQQSNGTERSQPERGLHTLLRSAGWPTSSRAYGPCSGRLRRSQSASLRKAATRAAYQVQHANPAA